MELSPGERIAYGFFTSIQYRGSIASLNASLSKVLLNRNIFEIYIMFLWLSPDL